MQSYEDSIRATVEAAGNPSRRERRILHSVVRARFAAQMRAAGDNETAVEQALHEYDKRFEQLDEEFELERDLGQRLGFNQYDAGGDDQSWWQWTTSKILPWVALVVFIFLVLDLTQR